MKIKKVALGRLRPWKDNPRDITPEGLERLAAQIQELGLYKPLLATPDGKEFVILGGNMKLQAFERLGWPLEQEIEISVVDAPTDELKLKYALSDNDEAGRTDLERLRHLAARAGMTQIDLEDFRIQIQEPQPITLASFPLDAPVEPGIRQDHETSSSGKAAIETGKAGSQASPSPSSEISDKIKAETEYQNEGPDPDVIIQSISAIVRTLAKENPEALRKAFLLITPIGRGRTFLLLADPSTEDAALEIKRLAQAGERSPLEAFLQGAIPLDVPVEVEGPRTET